MQTFILYYFIYILLIHYNLIFVFEQYNINIINTNEMKTKRYNVEYKY